MCRIGVAWVLLFTGCIFDPGGIPLSAPLEASTPDGTALDIASDRPGSDDQGPGVDADSGPAPDGAPPDTLASDAAAPDTHAPDATAPDTMPPPDVTAPDTTPPCAGLTCPLGCDTTLNRCYRLKPTNFVVTSFFDGVTGSITGTGMPIEINTDNGSITTESTVIRPANQTGIQNGIHWSTVTQGAGYPTLSVFGMVSLTLPAGGTINVVGKNALAIYCTKDATIAGTFEALPGGATAGPGGFDGGKNGNDGAACFGGQGKKGDQAPTWDASGGGGGGRKVAGSEGGSSTHPSPDLAGGAGGGANGGQPLTPLYGGCGGGSGGGGTGSMSAGGDGGGGGAALQIAANGAISISGTVNAPGAGGSASSYYAGGGGGGSGGAILLEAPSVTVTGFVAANGGGGGGGGGNASAGSGEDGLPSTSPAAGGKAGGYGSTGGAGGARATEGGSAGTSTTYEAGGGGGSVGRIHLNALPAQISVGTNNASPAPATGSSLTTW